MKQLCVIFLFGLVVAFGCTDAPDKREGVSEEPHLVFWESLEALCGQCFEGRLVESQPPNESFDGQRFVMHVRRCNDNEIRIPFYIGDNRSRTWVISRTETGLRLKHDHRHEDGTEDEITQYGGDTQGTGTAAVQDFHADAFTANLIPAASTKRMDASSGT